MAAQGHASHAHVWNHIFNFINSMSLKCAVELGIPDVIHNHGGSVSLSDLATELGVPTSKGAGPLRRLMRMLVHSGFFATKESEGEGDVVYLLTEASTHLLRDRPTTVVPFLLMMLDPVLVNPWHSMGAWFQGEEPTPFHVTYGDDFWGVAGSKPGFGKAFDEAMASDACFLMKLVVKECRESFAGLRSLVDVGGGTGAAASVIADAFPHVKCSVLELQHVVANSMKVANLDFVVGDMFEFVPPADTVLLKWILHDWSDEECVKILRRCKDAIPSKEDGGKVIIVDMVVDFNQGNHEDIETQYFFDLLMMVHSTGKERNEFEWHKIFLAAGFSGYKIICTFGLRSFIEVYP